MQGKKHPAHIKHIDTIGHFAVWLVDGGYIRKELNENFVKFDHHEHFSFIPQNELWIDMETDPAERQVFIGHFLAEESLIRSGVSKESAHDTANILEEHEREKIFQKDFASLKNDREALLARVKLTLLSEYSNEFVRVWLIDGKLVRDFFFIEYAEGGHDRVYTFIPAGEVWVEEVLSFTERPFIILHELHERILMSMEHGKKYPEAHQGATIVEDYYRNHPDETEERILKELAAQTP